MIHVCKMAMRLKNNNVRDVEITSFDSPFEANIRLIEQGVELIKCDPSIQESNIKIHFLKTNLNIQASLPFMTAKATF